MKIKLSIEFDSTDELAKVASKLEELKDLVSSGDSVETPKATSSTKSKKTKAKTTKSKVVETTPEEDAQEAERIKNLSASITQPQTPVQQTPVQQPVQQQPVQQQPVQQFEDPSAVVSEILQLSDKLMGVESITLERKQAIANQAKAAVNVPEGVKPTTLQQPMLSQFRDVFKSLVNQAIQEVSNGGINL